MSKNSSQKSKQKLKKKIRAEISKKASTEKAKYAFLNATQEEIAEKLKPKKGKTVIFKGLPIELVHSKELEASRAANELSLPLEDFYTEVKIHDKKLKFHWVPLKSSVERAALYGFFESRFSEANAAAMIEDVLYFKKATTQDMRRLGYKEKHAIAIVYANYEGANYISCVMANKETKKLNIFPIANTQMLESISKTTKLQASAFVWHIAELSNCALAIQYIVGLYLEGKELPKITLLSKKEIRETEHKSTMRTPSKTSEAKGKNLDNCLAYIHYSVEDGSLKISNTSSKHFEMKWWIVSGHQRHYKSGKVTDVRPFIKGDKDDPQAQQALKEFIEGYERTRIKFYQLIANRAE